jgi:hypothetical protein
MAALVWQVTLSAAGSPFPFGTLAAPTFRLRVPAIYGTAVTHACTLYLRHKATMGGVLRLVVTPVGGVAANVDTALATTFGSWANSSYAIALPATGTAQELDVQIQLWNASAGTRSVSVIGIIGAEG